MHCLLKYENDECYTNTNKLHIKLYVFGNKSPDKIMYVMV